MIILSCGHDDPNRPHGWSCTTGEYCIDYVEDTLQRTLVYQTVCTSCYIDMLSNWEEYRLLHDDYEQQDYIMGEDID